MKLWKKITIGLGVLAIYAVNQGNSQTINKNSVITPASSLSTQETSVPAPKTQIAPQTLQSETIKTESNIQSPTKNLQPSPEPAPIEKAIPINTYTNSAGTTVQSPTYYDSTPQGATAKCKDGTYSFSQSRRGTCSRHGGVAQWL